MQRLAISTPDKKMLIQNWNIEYTTAIILLDILHASTIRLSSASLLPSVSVHSTNAIVWCSGYPCSIILRLPIIKFYSRQHLKQPTAE